MTIEEKIISDLVNDLREQVVTNQDKLGLRASGFSARSLTHEVTKNGDLIVGTVTDVAGYFQYQETGRRPGKMPPIRTIYDWLQYKKYGINYRNDQERRRIAFAIAKKQAKEGSYLFRRGPSGVISDIDLKKFVEQAATKLADAKAIEYKNLILSLN